LLGLDPPDASESDRHGKCPGCRENCVKC
jgi:hypothetical protein